MMNTRDDNHVVLLAIQSRKPYKCGRIQGNTRGGNQIENLHFSSLALKKLKYFLKNQQKRVLLSILKHHLFLS